MTDKDFRMTCPIPISDYPQILLAHGGGGKLMHQLIEKMFASTFNLPGKDQMHDATVFDIENKKLAFTTDSYVIHPIFFPGGDIGSLAIHGTVNDLCMAGSKPLYLSAGFILEEGLKIEDLWRVVQSMKQAADKAGVKIITGDTKVVDRGKGDGIFINTSGVGVIEHEMVIGPQSVEAGDVILVNGDLARHGMAIMAVREGLAFESSIESDSAPLNEVVNALIENNIEIHCMRDLTRGGLASALNEIALSTRLEINIDESMIPVREDVSSACEILGLDPLYVANEGRFACFVKESDQEKALVILNQYSANKDARIIGKVADGSSSRVIMKSKIGAKRIIDMLAGEQLPRIC